MDPIEPASPVSVTPDMEDCAGHTGGHSLGAEDASDIKLKSEYDNNQKLSYVKQDMENDNTCMNRKSEPVILENHDVSNPTPHGETVEVVVSSPKCDVRESAGAVSGHAAPGSEPTRVQVVEDIKPFSSIPQSDNSEDKPDYKPSNKEINSDSQMQRGEGDPERTEATHAGGDATRSLEPSEYDDGMPSDTSGLMVKRDIADDLTAVIQECNVADSLHFDFDWVQDDGELEISKESLSILQTELFHCQNDQQCTDVMSALRNQSIEGSFCDVTLNVNGRAYNAHKCVLVANSSVLHSAISNLETGVLDMGSQVASPEALECILEYMYTGRFTSTISKIHDVLDTCKQLALREVMHLCEVNLVEHVSINTWAEILKLANKFQFEEAEKTVLTFITKNFFHLYRQKDFLDLPSDVITEVLQHYEHNRSPNIAQEKLDMLLRWAVHDYNMRQESYPTLLRSINSKLFTKESIEMLLGQKLIRNHSIFEHEATLIFMEAVRSSILENLTSSASAELIQYHKRKPRKPSKPMKIRKRGRPRKKVDYAQMVESEPLPEEIEADSPAQETVVILTKRKRGRPRKNPAPVPAISTLTGVIEGQTETTAGSQLAVSGIGDGAEKKQFDHKRLRIMLAKVKKKALRHKNQEVFQCPWPFCKKRFPSRRKLTRHVHIHNPKTINCELCEYKTSRNDKLRDHFRRVHPVEATDRGYMDQEALERKQQQQQLSQSKSHKTPSPKRQYTKMKDIKEEDMLQCLKCPRKFSTPSMLSHHMKGHGSETPFLCEICGFSTKHFASINVHKRQHNGLKFRCEFPGCSYANVRKGRLDDHMNTHFGVKNHVCVVCGKAFSGKKHMQRHEKLHVDVKPLSCDQCEYRSTRRDKLNEHIRKHHPNTAVTMGILDPNKVADKKLLDESKQKPPRKPRKRKAKFTIDQDHSVMSTVVQSEPGVQAAIEQPKQEMVIDQSANYVTMTVPQHLIGASTLNEDMIQYLASMTSGGLVASTHPQLQITPMSVPIQGTSQVLTPQSGVSAVSQNQSVIPVGTTQRDLGDTEQRNDTWVYHIVPDNQQF